MECSHAWRLGEPRSEIREDCYWHIADGVCTQCGASREFATNMDEFDRKSFKWMDNKFTNRPTRPPLNDVFISWGSD